MNTLHKPTLETVFQNMKPATLASMISDLDDAITYCADTGDAATDDLYVMQLALDTLFSIVGPAKAIEFLAVYEVDASNPLVADAVEEWTEDDWYEDDTLEDEGDEDPALLKL